MWIKFKELKIGDFFHIQKCDNSFDGFGELLKKTSKYSARMLSGDKVEFHPSEMVYNED